MPGSAVALEEQHKICLFNKADVTLKNNGYALAPAWGYSWYDGSSGGGRTYATTENPIMVVDAANYFTF